MIFSVWNAPARAYDYYDSPGTPASLSGPETPSHLRKRPALGIAPSSAAWPLPSDARMVGRGPYARGAVATSAAARGAMGDTAGDGSGMILAAGLGVAAWLLWKGSKGAR